MIPAIEGVLLNIVVIKSMTIHIMNISDEMTIKMTTARCRNFLISKTLQCFAKCSKILLVFNNSIFCFISTDKELINSYGFEEFIETRISGH